MGIGKTLSRLGERIQHRVATIKHKKKKPAAETTYKEKQVQFAGVEYAKDRFVPSKEKKSERVTVTTNASVPLTIENKPKRVFDPAISARMIENFSQLTQNISAELRLSECKKSVKTIFHTLPGDSDSFYFYDGLSFSKQDNAIARMDCERLVTQGLEAKNLVEEENAQLWASTRESLDLVKFYESYAQYASAVDELVIHQQLVRTLSSEKEFHELSSALYKLTNDLRDGLSQLDSKEPEKTFETQIEEGLQEFERLASQLGRLPNVTEAITRHLSALRSHLDGEYNSHRAQRQSTLPWPLSFFFSGDCPRFD